MSARPAARVKHGGTLARSAIGVLLRGACLAAAVALTGCIPIGLRVQNYFVPLLLG